LHCPPGAIAAIKADALRFAGLEFSDEEFEDMADGHAARRRTDEAAEGVKSFLEKRKPSWYPGN
jgi:methylglutaconyl-CoA hydratase